MAKTVISLPPFADGVLYGVMADDPQIVIKEYRLAMTAIFDRLLILDAGLPRPVITLQDTMPFSLPVDQDVVEELVALGKKYHPLFSLPELLLSIFQETDHTSKREMVLAHPFVELTQGQVMTDPKVVGFRVKLVRITVRDVPPEWRSETPLILLMHLEARHARHASHWIAKAYAPPIILRVPRTERTGGGLPSV